MIFNPLFLSENTGSQILAPKQTKMSNNKYLFSDIVKVVMTPIDEQKEEFKTANPLIGSNVGLALENDQKPVQLKLKFLSDLDSENAKLGLAEILPIEIAQLLIKDETESNEEKAVSYISNEPLAGELQNFVNNLIGTEIIETHISDKSGLLLSLEDSKSAVNLELAQVNGEKSISDKIVVKTLVVPEKSKLLSLMGDVQNKKGLFRIDNTQIQNLNNLGESISNPTGALGESKPTLSVYSFNYASGGIDSLTKNVQSGQELKNNLNLIKNQSTNSINIQGNNDPIDKISFIPSELKNTQQVPVGIMTENKSQLKPMLGDLKLFRTGVANVPKDYSVNKITIVKKQVGSTTPEKLQISNNLSSEKLDSELKRIDFGKTLNSKNISIPGLTSVDKEKTTVATKLTNENNSLPKNTSKISEIAGGKQPKAVQNNLSKTLSGNQLASIKNIQQTVTTENKTDPNNNNKSNSAIETAGQPELKNTQQSVLSKNVEPANTSKTELKQEVKIIAKGSVVENGKLQNSEHISKNNVVDSDKLKGQQTTIINEVNKNTNEQVSNLKNINNTTNIETQIKNENTDAKLTNKQNLVSNEKLNSNISAGTNDVKENVVEVEKGSKNIDASKTENNANEKSIKSVDKLNMGEANESKQIQSDANKKISVKVKGGVKSVSEKLDTQPKNAQELKQNETSAKNNDSSKENSSSNEFRNTPFSNSQFNMKVSNENGFQQFLSENEMAAMDRGLKEAGKAEIENESKLKVVKSADVIKEVTKFISKQEKGSLSFDIKPEHLGKMKITLDTTEHVVRARIEVESEQSKHLIEKNLDKLHQELAENGVELNSLNISLSNPKHNKEEKEMMERNSSKTENNGQVGEAEEKEQKKQLGYNTYEYIA